MKKIISTTIATLAVSSTLMAANTASCVACHGANFDKNTIMAAKVPANLTKAAFYDALVHPKGMMINLAKPLSDADKKAIADKYGK
ncbi:MAG: cytochrome C [Campylobacterota bacterium]|nr:cytochrome C [Campylobacterota bacterium]